MWQGHRNPRNGYGQQTTYAHRLAYLLTHGDIPAEMVICHRCDNPPCCNPTHLFLGTQAENMQDRVAKAKHRPLNGSHQQVVEVRNREHFPISFWQSVTQTDGCWTWRGYCNPRNGYGHYTLYAHRLAYLLTHGDIPPKMVVCHRCDNPPCCNPAHLFLGTQVENMQDRDSKGRNGVQGQPHPQRRLTMDDARAIRRDYSAGVPIRQLAAQYQIHRSTLNSITLGRTYREEGQGQ